MNRIETKQQTDLVGGQPVQVVSDDAWWDTWKGKRSRQLKTDILEKKQGKKLLWESQCHIMRSQHFNGRGNFYYIK